jgi:hypothetical protein
MEHPTEAHHDNGPTVEVLMSQLRDPVTLLANALSRVHQADTMVADLPGVDQALYQVAAGQVLARIAKAAADLAEQEQRRTLETIDDSLDTPAPADAYEPKAVPGVRFTATVTGTYLGRIGDSLWLHVPTVGFMSVSGGVAIEFAAVGSVIDVGFSGRVVSATPDHILGVTDGGTGVTLPRALIVEGADE